jgi:hypothetical protein
MMATIGSGLEDEPAGRCSQGREINSVCRAIRRLPESSMSRRNRVPSPFNRQFARMAQPKNKCSSSRCQLSPPLLERQRLKFIRGHQQLRHTRGASTTDPLAGGPRALPYKRMPTFIPGFVAMHLGGSGSWWWRVVVGAGSMTVCRGLLPRRGLCQVRRRYGMEDGGFCWRRRAHRWLSLP